ncbi:hypothetical protein TNCT_109551 [Trichonephila clavata]|uniref:Uncharacterized protein n=1 Tax=Trichonephila clavata TaxID=2740835 RepID=A0A8X6KLH3_TRICU|nr:hypothetical protein TNCT_109551 [Trichonephila clavata]
MKDITRKSITETTQGKDALVIELESLPPCNNPHCIDNIRSENSSPVFEKIKINNENSQVENNSKEIPDPIILSKRSKKRKGKSKKILRMTLSSQKELPDPKSQQPIVSRT